MLDFIKIIEEFGNMTAFKSLAGKDSFELSYNEYLNEVSFCAYNLNRTFGDLRGRHIGLLCESNIDYTIIMLALVFSRAVVIPINSYESTDNISHIINDSETEAIIIDKEYQEKISIDVPQYNKATLLVHSNLMTLTDFSEDEADNPLFIIYTSGTTSLSKGVVLTVANQFGVKKQIINSDFMGGPDALPGMKIYNNFPFYHVAGIVALLGTLECGCTLYLSANPKNILFDLDGESIDVGFATPAVLKLWKKAIKRGNTSRLGGLNLVATAGAKIDRETVDAFLNNGIRFCQFYGMTETGGNVTCNFDIGNHIESVGLPIPGVNLFIQDEEICISGQQIMQGYYNNPKETDKCLQGGVIHTGDLGYIDQDGYVYITGRKKNLIILSSGENVSPEELEKMLYKCDSIVECKVYESIDRIVAGVFAPKEYHEDIREYVSDLNKTLPLYKRIHNIEFTTEEFEKTASGKIKRH